MKPFLGAFSYEISYSDFVLRASVTQSYENRSYDLSKKTHIQLAKPRLRAGVLALHLSPVFIRV